MSDLSQSTQSLKSEAQRLGFAVSGCAPTGSTQTFAHFEAWLDDQMNGEMKYMETRREAYRHPNFVMSGSVSVLMLAMPYQTKHPVAGGPQSGRIARYAWGQSDYHDLIHDRLKQLCRFTRQIFPDANTRGVVDTAPLLERELAQASGIGWAAKNTMLIHKTIGSYFFLAAMLIDCPLEYDSPFSGFHCGTCTACIDACPTDAFVSPHVLDANRCISYLTIEHRSPIDVALRPLMEDWVLGCDVCQEVCPWNRKAPLAEEPAFEPLPGHNPLSLSELFELDDDQFRKRFRKTPLWRPKRRGILRNAAIALGNSADSASINPLTIGLHDDEPLVRGASAWALRQIDDSAAVDALTERKKIESDDYVLSEIEGTYQSTSSTL